jgi:hypothetical protein
MPTLPLFVDESRVPARLAGLAFAGSEVDPDPRLGAKLRFGDGTVQADASLYTLGLEDLAEDLRAPLTVDLYREACGEVLHAAGQGLYQNLEVHVSQFLHLPSGSPEPFCLWAAFGYCQAPGPAATDDGPRSSHLTLRIDRGHVNKVRYTYPAERDEEELPRFLQFLLEWTAAVRALP